MKKTNTKALALCIGAAAFALAAAGCSFQTGSTPTRAMSDPSAAQTSAGQNGSSASAENGASSDPSADPFYDLLMQGDPDAVMDYINQHIAGASEIDKEDYILGLCRMTDDLTEIDFSRLAPSAEWLPEDMNHFIAIMEQEYQNPVSADGIIMAPIPELLERALQFEEQKNLYPDGITAPIAAELYEERMNAAIAGGYSKNMQTPSQYLNDEGSYAVSGGGKDGAPRSVAITAADMRDAVLPLVDNIIEVVMNVLDQTPPELAAEILRKGIFLTGGSSRIPGLQEYLEQAFELPLTPLYDGPSSVAIGGAKFLDDKRFLSDLLGVKLD